MVEHPIHPTASIMESVLLQGNISIGVNIYAGTGSIITANGGHIEISANMVIVENAILCSYTDLNKTGFSTYVFDIDTDTVGLSGAAIYKKSLHILRVSKTRGQKFRIVNSS